MLARGWKRLSRKKVYEAKDGGTIYMELFQDEVQTPKGRRMRYTHFSSSDVVVVVPFIDEKRLVMIRQYRYPLNKVMIEFPAGHVEKSESPLASARRELKEETGYSADKLEHVYYYHPSVSKSRQTVHVYRATGLKNGKTNHDGTEDIRVEIVGVGKLASMISRRKVENAGTLIAYLLCCTGMKIKGKRSIK